MAGAPRVPRADVERWHELRVGVDGRPRPNGPDEIATLAAAPSNRPFRALRRWDVFLLRIDEAPDFVALEPLARKVTHHLVLILSARRPGLGQEPEDGALGAIRHAARSPDRVPFAEGSDYPGTPGGIEAIHNDLMPERSAFVKPQSQSE